MAGRALWCVRYRQGGVTMVTVGNLLSAAVGFGAPNRPLDVRRIQILLNAVPTIRGGPFPLLQVDGLCGPMSCGAIRRFQSSNLGFADSVISPGQKTVTALTTVLQGLGLLAQLLSKLPTDNENSGTLGSTVLREKIRLAAHAATLGPYGIVSDRDTVVDEKGVTVRRGWENLKKFFDDTVVPWDAGQWKVRANWDGVRLPGKRVPAPGPPPGVQWCGIFGTWIWQQAGKSTQWKTGLGPTHAVLVNGNQGIQVGDICVQTGTGIHHFVAVDVNGDTIQGVNGNAEYQSILLRPMARSSVQYYYKPD
jgi:hypothetical protein